MSGASYGVRSIVDMARIPEDALPRFLAEFPLMLATARGIIQMTQELRASAEMEPATDAELLETLEGVTWIDDDKGNVSVRVDTENEAGERENLFDLKGNHKTKEVSMKFGPRVEMGRANGD